jgi:photosystem II stability/assembly factor-like uncharacterized protein
VLSFATNESGDLFAGTRFGKGVFRSNDGDGWSEKNNGLIATEVRAIAINASNTLFAGTYGIGMFRSADGGQVWEKVNNGLSALYEVASQLTPLTTFFWARIL